MATRIIRFEELVNVNGSFKPKGTLGRHHVVVFDSTDGGVDIFNPRICIGCEYVPYYPGLENNPDVEIGKDGRFYLQKYEGGEFLLHLKPGDIMIYNCGDVHKLPNWRKRLYNKLGYCPVEIVSNETLESLKKTRVDEITFNSYGRAVGKHGRECISYGHTFAVIRRFYDSPNNCGQGNDTYYFTSPKEALKYFEIIPGGKPQEFIGPAPRLNKELVYETKTFAVGGGEWSIEVYDEEGLLLKEFVGSNGTREPADDLWAEYEAWANQPEW